MISREPHNAVLTVEGIIDPLSTQAQALTPLLVLMQEWLQPVFRIYMNPQVSGEEEDGLLASEILHMLNNLRLCRKQPSRVTRKEI